MATEDKIARALARGKPAAAPAPKRAPTVRSAAAPVSRDCVFRGQDTGAKERCQSCRGSTDLKVFACSEHGTCTVEKRAGPHAVCADCRSRRSVAPQTFPDISVRHLLYHVYPRRNSRWRERVLRLREHIELFNGKKVVAVASDGTTDGPGDVADALFGTGCEILSIPNDPTGREAATFLPLFEKVAGRIGEDEAVLYGHAKGVTRPIGSTCQRWVEVLEEIMFGRWDRVAEVLRTHPIAGCFKKLGSGWNAMESRSDWHYSGSWVWYRTRELFAKKDWRRIDGFWGGIEPYPSLHFSQADAGCVFHQGAVPSLNLYDSKYWKAVVEPAYARWKAKENPRETSGLLNLGCGPHYAPGWVNVDVVRTGTIRPDIVVNPDQPLPFADGSFDRAFLGHVLEHVPWDRVVPLLRDVLRVLAPGGQVAVVGPDLQKSLAALLENPDRRAAMAHVWDVAEDFRHHQVNEPDFEWDAGRHHWNCYGKRVAWAVSAAGFSQVREAELTPEVFGTWPIVDYTNRNQCAVLARS